MKRRARIHIITEIFLNLPEMALRSTNDIIPSMIPSEMLYARGIRSMVTKAGIASE